MMVIMCKKSGVLNYIELVPILVNDGLAIVISLCTRLGGSCQSDFTVDKDESLPRAWQMAKMKINIPKETSFRRR